ncbi:hypothetical protein BX659_11491 [Orenia metallireducens]|jgi:hypothetical protein|uniref:Uncharacterized protein n=1 Tax=Orenia metallireducens TaxID=1413210 RepID=A0A285IC20_9FIRM|nr:hypothetical protein [Orenia metallireducens]PRX28040.1 hypothetical protein BX659_11491 [Orenia metallireducens]SNY45554.1 hypothetical protein SAMN06265827_13832 [Orenia metallireducens]
MSLVLGHIHYWLYDQIKVVEDREVEVVDAFKEKYGQDVEGIASKVREEYGELKGDTPLEDLIGESHIHPWLEGAISTAQSREAALVRELKDKYDDQELLVDTYRRNGAAVAQEGLKEIKSNDLRTAFELLKNTLVERMPCDRLSAVVKSEEDIIVWRHDIKLHIEFWKAAQAPVELMHQLYSNWIESFITTVNPEIKHERKVLADQYEDIFTI